MGEKSHQTFGQWLRSKRTAQGWSLRKFAQQVGVSPTYLSQVEQGLVDPPTSERVRKMAELLGESSDAMIGLAGRVPEDLPPIIQKRPQALPELLRAAHGLSVKQIRQLTQHARALQEEGQI